MRRALALSLVVVAVTAGCSRTANINLQIVEPCDQANVALNGVSSFTVSTEGAEPDPDPIAFKSEEPPEPLLVGLGNVTVTVKGFAEDITGGGAASTAPQAVGRTMPLSLTAQSGDVDALVAVGQVDTFGRTTNAAGECTEMTAGAALKGRHGHTATFVPLINKVLIFGGAVFRPDGTEGFLPTAELYDPATGTFEEVGQDDNLSARAFHTATAAPDGRVFIVGGFGVVGGQVVTLGSIEIFDPVARSFNTGQLLGVQSGRAHHTATLMEGVGLIAIVGGCTTSGAAGAQACTPRAAGVGNNGPSTNLITTVETIDLSTDGTSTDPVPALNGLVSPRAFHAAVAIEQGPLTTLVVAGGIGGVNGGEPVCDIELFRANGGALARIDAGGINLNFPADRCPSRAAMVVIPGVASQEANEVVIIGGLNEVSAAGEPTGLGMTDVSTFSTVAGLTQQPQTLFQGATRFGHVAAPRDDGSIVVVGGATSPGAPSAEVLERAPGTGLLTSRVMTRANAQPVDRAALAVLPTNQILFSGGHSLVPPFVTSAAVEIYYGP